MGSVRSRKENRRLFFDFRYRDQRFREYTLLEDTPANRKKMQKVLDRIEAEITLGSFDYAYYFPGSPNIDKLANSRAPGAARTTGRGTTFNAFSEEWYQEREPEWKQSYRQTVRSTMALHLLPHFGEMRVDRITKADILKFRSTLAKETTRNKKALSADRINHIMTTLRMILSEAADRLHFTDPWHKIKPLKVLRPEVDPFSLAEVRRFIEEVRPDFRHYYIVRFFTGLRTGEIDGLRWPAIDFKRRHITVRETLVDGREETPKTPGSFRHIQMSQPVVEALRAQQLSTGSAEGYVFCNRKGNPLEHRNVTRRIWHPTLKRLGLKPRRPYQTRHTAATLWLAAGENPEWIARQMGHSNTKMLFEVYSRYVPNLTRQDGSAFERLLGQALPPTSLNAGDQTHE